MALMKLIVFDVEDGRCVYIRTPGDYGILIDCSKDSSGKTPSPVQWIAENEESSLKRLINQNPVDQTITDIVEDPGVKVSSFSLTEKEATVIVITWNTDEGYRWKAVIAGDIEASGLEALLEEPEFNSEIKDADFLVTPTQGRESGFSEALFNAMGKPLANISSNHGGDKQVDTRYNKNAQGVKFPDGSRKHFVTGGDGNITVEMHEDGRYDVWLLTP